MNHESYPLSSLEDTLPFADNPDQRCPCVIVLDVSGSMRGDPVAELNKGLCTLADELQADEIASRRVELGVITFGGRVKVVQELIEAGQFLPPTLATSGHTPMGKAINTALNLLEERKALYRKHGIPYVRPWLFLITDGAPTDDIWAAAQRLKQAITNKQIAFFPIGVTGADMNLLAGLSPDRTPLKLQGLKFQTLFEWLSNSLSEASASVPDAQVPLGSVQGWAEV